MDNILELKKTVILCANMLNGEFGTYKWYDSFAPMEDFETAKDWLCRFSEEIANEWDWEDDGKGRHW